MNDRFEELFYAAGLIIALALPTYFLYMFFLLLLGALQK